ncbi:beta-N-acetylglucosaminidase domain-containing protein [Streptomyces sp. TRM S81-3]|uniref:Beta-N-acetylglucosaminidase domain-containing protein n=1 Tax=Streptomyces griseicoloratus TaxID=2752516 RepID=A0A926QV57_9ACTN|nr:beta-N-acetylglucosaminidase domain-containing protein [Streptomyces griseicoloratus]MBD0424660.1 beta-N-acetylglucosaminidase domain-containing protein [Streptomyces griseicoloratus]
MDRRTRTLATAGACFAIAIMPLGSPPAAAVTDAATDAAAPAVSTLPPVSPTPQSLTPAGRDAVVTGRVIVVAGEGTDAGARARLVRELTAHGADRVDIVSPGEQPRAAAGLLTVRLGPATRADIAAALGDTQVPDRAEGYALRVTAGRQGAQIALAGKDPAGQFYAVQTLRQLFARQGDDGWKVAGVQISDFPSMPLRGTIEGFYGQPWTHAERLDQMDFYGDVKANTYIYAPKDDPYHRGKWREPYPADKLAELGELVRRATANHVRFTFAVSPGESICYSDPADRKALKAKLQALYDLGTRAFSIPLDDISYTRWNCESDRSAFGEPGRGAAARAQVDLLNDVQRTFIATHEGAQPLQMVPTEYGDLTDTAYKQTLRGTLDPAVEVMWTGTDVVPPKISNEEADKASALFGRKVFVWDNYPVNDFGNTSGRLLLAPYDKREAGLSAHLSGIVANPMNQPYASKVAVFGTADFTWNDRAYDARTSWPRAMAYLAGGDREATDALLVFGDLEHLAPTFGATPWQPQAPELARRVAEFWTSWDDGNRTGAVRALRAYATAVERAPATIRGGAVETGFTVDADPWLDATELWGRAMVTMLDALAARQGGDKETADRLLAESNDLQQRARAVRVDPPRNSWGKAQPRVGDGVLDSFLVQADVRLRLWDAAGGGENLALKGTASASSVEQNLDRLAARHVNDGLMGTRWASGYSDDAWVQVRLAAPAKVAAVTLAWEGACATEYTVQTSRDGVNWRDVSAQRPDGCGTDVVRLTADEAVQYVRMQGVERRTTWGYSIYEMGVYGAPAS